MARIFKEEDYTIKRNEILNVTQKLVYVKGYEHLSIQEVIDELKISKGAFYHYFKSKQELLEALIDRISKEMMRLLGPMIADPNLSAQEKLQRFFNTSAQWKTEHKDYLLALMRSWYSDENAIIREKITASMIADVAPLLTAIFEQGTREKVFTTRYPDQAGEIVISLFIGMGESFGKKILTDQLSKEDVLRLERVILAYTDALERAIGAQPGTIHLMDTSMLKGWINIPTMTALAPTAQPAKQ